MKMIKSNRIKIDMIFLFENYKNVNYFTQNIYKINVNKNIKKCQKNVKF